jgi:L-aminopeptidase/D-esterase-like protein
MTCYDWKGGIGTSSRIVMPFSNRKSYKVGVLVQANHGVHGDLAIRGVPVGREMTPPGSHHLPRKHPKSSVIVVIATDAPILPHQLKRLARRAALGVGRTGTYTNNFSGELFLAISTANKRALKRYGVVAVDMLPNDDHMDCLFEATVDATEEAIINAMVAAKTVRKRKGVDGKQHDAWGITDPKLPPVVGRLADVMKYYKRWAGP